MSKKEEILHKLSTQDRNCIKEKFKSRDKQIIDFINELAWQDVQYDAFQSTAGEFPGSPSAVPRYAKKYFDLWKQMFKEDLTQKEINNGERR